MSEERLTKTFIPEVWSKPLLRKYYESIGTLLSLLPPARKLTRSERLKLRFYDLKKRVCVAWNILTGEIDPDSFEDW